MFYRLFRAITALALRLFFRMEATVDPQRRLAQPGPVIFVGNHPNGLIDPAVLFALVERQVTFLAKEPLFRMPVLGQILRGLDALPVFRKQDGPGDTSKNEGTLTAAVGALVSGRALTLFPEGKSHSEPQLAELKTGAARIALEAARQGADVTVVPIGITYSAKHRYRSRVHVEVGEPLSARAFLEQLGEDPHHAARRLTESMSAGLERVTLNLDAWEDLPVLQTAEALDALRRGARAGDVERTKAFSRGMSLLRAEQPERFDQLKQELSAFRRRLDLLAVKTTELQASYRPATVAWFAIRNLIWLSMVPVFVLGLGVFVIPYYLPLLAVKIAKPDVDVESTVKLLTAFVVAPLWWGALTLLAFAFGGWPWGLLVGALVPPLALFTRASVEDLAATLRDIRTFVVLGSRARLTQHLLDDGNRLSATVERLVAELGPRVA